jgi:hypothetical protein
MKTILSIIFFVSSICILLCFSACYQKFIKKKPITTEQVVREPDIELYANRLLNEIIEKISQNYSDLNIKSVILDFKEIKKSESDVEFETTFLSKLISDVLKNRMAERAQFSLMDEDIVSKIYDRHYIDSIFTYSPLLVKNIGKISSSDILIAGSIEEIENGNKIEIKNNVYDSESGDSVLSFEFAIEKRNIIPLLDVSNGWDRIITKKNDINKGVAKIYFKYNLSIPPPSEPKYNIIQKTPLTDQDLTCDKFLELPSDYRSLFQSITWPRDISITVDDEEFSNIKLDIIPDIAFRWSTELLVVEKEYLKGNHTISIKFTEIVPRIEFVENQINRMVEKKWEITFMPNITNNITIEYRISEKATPALLISEAWTEKDLKYFDLSKKTMIVPKDGLSFREVN